MPTPLKLIPPNPLYPLPEDYDTLTAGGQRQARVNASRQWLIDDTDPKVVADRMVASLAFFDAYYLRPDGNFDPGFYEGVDLTTPEMHWAISRLWATERLSITVAPRGSAKSTHSRRDILLRMVTCPKYSFVYATSTHDNANYNGNVLRNQCYGNDRIGRDFSTEYGVSTLKPTRGDFSTGIEHFYLTNSSWCRMVSVQTRIRGVRPRRFRIDDPEFDPSASTAMEVVRANMEHLIFSIAIPTVMHGDAGIDWIATYVSPRHYAWHAMQLVNTPEGPQAADPRFNYWARFFVPAAFEGPDGKLQSCWPEMWPVDEKERAGRRNCVSLERMREIMGVRAFNREMLGQISTSEESFFHLDPDPRGKHAWWYEDVDPALNTYPRGSLTKICWKDTKTDKVVKMPLAEFLRQVRIFMTVDSSFTQNAHSDRKATVLMAVNQDNVLFVLDLWSDRTSEASHLEATLKMADLWQCGLICVEVVKESLNTWQRFSSAVRTRFTENLGATFVPAVKDLRPGSMPKPAKISILDTRFEHGLIKLPLFARATKAPVDRLLTQIEGFDPNVDSGGLQHDDELDGVSMSSLVIRGRVAAFVSAGKQQAAKLDAIEEITSGRNVLPGGATLLSGLDPSLLSGEQAAKLLAYASQTRGPKEPTKA